MLHLYQQIDFLEECIKQLEGLKIEYNPANYDAVDPLVSALYIFETLKHYTKIEKLNNLRIRFKKLQTNLGLYANIIK